MTKSIQVTLYNLCSFFSVCFSPFPFFGSFDFGVTSKFCTSFNSTQVPRGNARRVYRKLKGSEETKQREEEREETNGEALAAWS